MSEDRDETHEDIIARIAIWFGVGAGAIMLSIGVLALLAYAVSIQ